MILTSHIAAIAMALLAFSPAQAPADQPGRDYFGINVQSLFLHLPPDQWDRHLDAIQGAGITSARIDALWWMAEPRPPFEGRHRYRWTRLDSIAHALAEHGIRWYPVVSYSAFWAASIQGEEKSPPADVGEYAEYARNLAARYGPGGDFWRQNPGLPQLPVVEWEIWNEPNTTFFWRPGPDPERYAELYLAAHDAIHSVDPDARVIVGGLGDAPWFLPRMYAHRPELADTVDGVAIHPSQDTPEQTLALVAQYRRQLDHELGEIDVPLMITEIGWATAGTGHRRAVPDDLRSRYFAETARTIARSDCGVTRYAPYAWVTPRGDPQRQQRWFGLVQADANPTASSTAYADAIEDVRAAFSSKRRRPPRRTAICDRSVEVDVRTSRRPRRRGRPRRCYRATVTMASQPLRAARVKFRYPGRDRRGRRRRAVIRKTNGRGQAMACFSGSRSRARARSSSRLRVSATRPDLADVAVATARLP